MFSFVLIQYSLFVNSSPFKLSSLFATMTVDMWQVFFSLFFDFHIYIFLMNVISKVSEIYIYQSLTQGVGHHFDFLLFLFPGIVGILPDGKFPLGEYIGLNPALNLVGHT